MDIQKRIEKIGKYFLSMNVAPSDDGSYIMYVQVSFPDKWVVLENTPKLYDVQYTKDENNAGYYFWSSSSNAEKIFDAIDANIKMNEDAVAKINLLLLKIEELKTMFANDEYDLATLSTLEFKISQPKVPTKSKAKSKKTTEAKSSKEDKAPANEIITEEEIANAL